MTLDYALDYLKEAAMDEITYRGKPEHRFYKGVRWGTFNTLAKMGYSDAALEATREVEEDWPKSRRSRRGRKRS